MWDYVWVVYKKLQSPLLQFDSGVLKGKDIFKWRLRNPRMRIEAALCAVLLLVVEVVVAEPCCGRHHHHRGGGALVAGGLGFVGGFVAGRFSGRHHGGCCGRKRRDIHTFLQDPKIIETYKEIAEEDKDQCGKRLVCELAQREFEELVDDEEQILQPYRGDGISDGTIYGDYDEAAWHGQEGHSCAGNYPLCAFTATQVMGEYRKYSADNQVHS
ncbi:uncharacterized protein [Panulirus ornatus]|uniref:uncharacterized protein n=1 Tax=Panulirus ornatus TaxID=150431 RepID=UPI003A83A1C1